MSARRPKAKPLAEDEFRYPKDFILLTRLEGQTWLVPFARITSVLVDYPRFKCYHGEEWLGNATAEVWEQAVAYYIRSLPDPAFTKYDEPPRTAVGDALLGAFCYQDSPTPLNLHRIADALSCIADALGTREHAT